jgi:zinc D-Ala-D-Ala dipeptidase
MGERIMALNKSLLLKLVAFSTLNITSCFAANPNTLPTGFVYLKDIDPTIIQEMRYASYHNFIGHPIPYYGASECILTKQAAQALKQVQIELRKQSLSLKVYDCYRPQSAVNYFLAWSKKPEQQQMKAEFYPRVDKKDVFKLQYIAEKSGHSRGSTSDLTIVPIPTPIQETYHSGQTLVSCTAPYHARFHDSSIDMGTGYDCLDEAANIDYQKINPAASHNRMLLSRLMHRYGFVSYPKEWWHFTLRSEPFPKTYFDFPVQ